MPERSWKHCLKIFLGFQIVIVSTIVIIYLPRISVQTSVNKEKWRSWIVLGLNDITNCQSLHTIAFENLDWELVVADVDLSSCQIPNLHTAWSSNYEFLKHYPSGSRKRRMTGYLYAIQNGAVRIYDGDIDLGTTKNALKKFFFKKKDKFMVPQNYIKLINPYAHFGQRNIKNPYFAEIYSDYKPEYKLLPVSHPVVQYALSAEEDAYLDTSAPPFVVPKASQAPIYSRSTMIFEAAFWTLFFPQSYGEEISVLMQSLWSQKLLSLGNYTVAFLSSNDTITMQNSMKKENLSDVDWNLLQYAYYLLSWECKYEEWFMCIESLAIDLREKRLWSAIDYNLFMEWMRILQMFGYRVPQSETMNESGVHPELKKSFLFYPVEKKYKGSTKEDKVMKNSFKKICEPSKTPWFKRMMRKSSSFKDVVLIVHFNYKAESMVVEMVRLLNKPQFPTILLCGHPDDWQTAIRLGLSFIPSVLSHHARNSVDCDIIAMEMGYNVAGFLQIHDDIVLHPWIMKDWDRSLIWYTPQHKWMCAAADMVTGFIYMDNGTRLKAKFSFNHWQFRTVEFPKLKAVFEHMENAPRGSSLHNCHLNKILRLKRLYRFDYSQADHFYVPSRLTNDFSKVLTLFLEHAVYFEVAIPTALKCVEHPQHHLKIKFRHLYYHMRNNNDTYYTHMNYSYVHPYKFQQFVNDTVLRKKLFCNQIVAENYYRW